MRVGLLLLVSFCVSCGYGFVRYGGQLGDVRKVVIETPRNDSTDPGLEFVVADALRREFLRRRGARVIEDAAQADLVLSGSVRSLGEQGEAFSSVVLAIEYQLSMQLELSARRPDGSDVPIDPGAQRETEVYLSSPDVEAQRKNREEAVRHLAATLAGRVYDSLYETLSP